jgi:hypothetical protein
MPMKKSAYTIHNEKEAGKFLYKKLSKGKKDKDVSHV